MTIYSMTDKGMVRSSNQDSVLSGSFEHGVWGVVCDGMGGANGGDIASSLAVELIGGYLTEHLSGELNGNDVRSIIEEAVCIANSEIFNRAQNDVTLYGMGTTVVAAVVTGNSLYISHAGDSRAYLISGERINQITRDHSMVQELVDRGKLTQEEARNHPRRNVITRALGVYREIELDHNECRMEKGDIVLLCSDGLSNCVDDAGLLSIATETAPEELCKKYIVTANNNGGNDNITVLVIR